jgi:hypothetical protein
MLPGLVTLGCAAAVLAAPVSAQQMMQPASPSQQTALKNNVRTFEMALKTAVETAGMRLAQWASQQAPVPMAFAQDPSVRSVALLDDSLVFHVDVAEIVPTSLALFGRYQQMPPAARAGAARVGNTPPAGMVPPESAGPGKAPGGEMASLNMTPDAYYTSLVRDALIDTMLDSSGVLPLKAGQTLTVACIPVDVAVTNSLNRNPSRQLILTIKGEDLVALREGKLSREDAKQRIIDRRF